MLRQWQVHHFEEVTSTMDVAHDLLGSHTLSVEEGLIIRADQQTAGRGRFQRHWDSPSGNFYGSFAFIPAVSESDYPLYSYVISVALYNALEHLVNPGSDLKLKWPNDLLLKGKKIAGILLERSHEYLVVGIGINLRSAPENTSYPATYLSGVSVEDVLEAFIPHLNAMLDLFEIQGFGPLRQAWLAARYPQDEIYIRSHQQRGGSQIKGTFIDLDLEGRLIVQESQTNKYLKIAAGDVSL